MTTDLMTDAEAVREEAMTTDGVKQGRFSLRSITAADISYFERAGISKDIEVKEGGVTRVIAFGDHYKVHAGAYILSHDPKQISRELFNIENFSCLVDDWVREKDVTRDEFVFLAELILKMNAHWYGSTSVSDGNQGNDLGK